MEFATTGILLSISCLGICKYWNLKVKYNFESSMEVLYLKVMEFDSRGNGWNLQLKEFDSNKTMVVKLVSTVS